MNVDNSQLLTGGDVVGLILVWTAFVLFAISLIWKTGSLISKLVSHLRKGK